VRRPAAAVTLAAALFAAVGCDAPPPTGTGAIDNVLESIDAGEIRAHMSFLADDLLEGRAAGTRGYRLAARYVAAELESLGAEPRGTDENEPYYQLVPLRSANVVAEETSITVRRASGTSRTLRFGDDFIVSPSFRETSVRTRAGLTFAGYGIEAPELARNDYEGLEVSGRIVVVLSGAPESFGSTERAVYSSTETKAQTALDRGAVGILQVLSAVDQRRLSWAVLRERSGGPSMRWLDPDTGGPSGASSQLSLSGAVSTKVAEEWFRDTPFDPSSPFGVDSDGPDGFDLDIEIDATVASAFEDIDSPNVVGRVPGTDEALSSEHVVLTAHLDHVGRGSAQ
jgi:hypothetical protein